MSTEVAASGAGHFQAWGACYNHPEIILTIDLLEGDQ